MQLALSSARRNCRRVGFANTRSYDPNARRGIVARYRQRMEHGHRAALAAVDWPWRGGGNAQRAAVSTPA